MKHDKEAMDIAAEDLITDFIKEYGLIEFIQILESKDMDLSAVEQTLGHFLMNHHIAHEWIIERYLQLHGDKVDEKLASDLAEQRKSDTEYYNEGERV